jgi:MFS family permease
MSNTLIPKVDGITAARVRACKIGAYGFAIGTSPFAFFLGMTVGGNLGGGWGNYLFGSAGTVIGLGLGIFAVATISCGLMASIGFILARLVVMRGLVAPSGG